MKQVTQSTKVSKLDSESKKELEPIKKLKLRSLEIKQKGVKPGELDESLTPTAIPIPERS
jgi:hypothetical protein